MRRTDGDEQRVERLVAAVGARLWACRHIQRETESRAVGRCACMVQAEAELVHAVGREVAAAMAGGGDGDGEVVWVQACRVLVGRQRALVISHAFATCRVDPPLRCTCGEHG